MGRKYVRGSLGETLLLNFLRENKEDQTNLTIKGTSSDNLFWDSRITSRRSLLRNSGVLVNI
jgi:hypothetical protein